MTMTHTVRLLAFALATATAPCTLAQVAIRSVGGTGLERGEVVVPHSDGAVLVATSKLPNSEVLRVYVVHYDQDLDTTWTRILPTDALLEKAVDAWSEADGETSILTERLDAEVGHVPAIHRLDANGNTIEVIEPFAPQNFRPVRHVMWQNGLWMVGGAGSQPCAVNVDTEQVLTWGGQPGLTDQINDVAVHSDVLISVGSRTSGNTTATAIWGIYPFGQVAFEHIGPDDAAGNWSEAVAIEPGASVIRVLHNFVPPAPNDGDLLHSLISLNLNTGEVSGILEGPSSGQRPARDVTWTPQGWLKLSQTDVTPALGKSMLVTHYSEGGAFVTQGAWGINQYEDDPSRLTVDEDGVIWVAGSTRGAFPDSWNACLMRIDSLGFLEDWGGPITDLDAVNDPLMDLGELTLAVDRQGLRCAPNPTNHVARIMLAERHLCVTCDQIAWRLVNTQGQVVLEGSGSEVPLHNVAYGMHLLTGTLEGAAFSMPLLVAPNR